MTTKEETQTSITNKNILHHLDLKHPLVQCKVFCGFGLSLRVDHPEEMPSTPASPAADILRTEEQIGPQQSGM